MTLITGPDFNLIEAMYLDDESDEAFRNALRAAYEQGRRDAAPPPAAEPKWTEGAVCACGHKHVASALPGAPYVLCEAGTTDPRACACREWRPRGCDYAGCSGHANGDDGLCGECRARMSPGGRDYDGPSQPEATGAAWTCPTCRRTFYAMSQDHHHECRPGACAAEPEATACPACGGSGVIDAGLDSRPCPVCRPEEYGGTGRAPAGGAP